MENDLLFTEEEMAWWCASINETPSYGAENYRPSSDLTKMRQSSHEMIEQLRQLTVLAVEAYHEKMQHQHQHDPASKKQRALVKSFTATQTYINAYFIFDDRWIDTSPQSVEDIKKEAERIIDDFLNNTTSDTFEHYFLSVMDDKTSDLTDGLDCMSLNTKTGNYINKSRLFQPENQTPDSSDAIVGLKRKMY